MEDLSIGKVISSIYRNQNVIINKLCHDLGFGSSQYLYLIKVHENPGITQKELSELILIDRANTNRALKKLSDLGYVEIKADSQDARNKRTYLTDSGLKTVKELKTRLQNVTAILKDGISDDDMIVFQRTIHQMEKNIITKVKEHHG